MLKNWEYVGCTWKGAGVDQCFYDAVEASPIIAAIKDWEGLEKCLQTDSKVIFVLFGDVCTISDIVSKVKETGKIVIVHADLITGLSGKEISVDYIKKYTQADGIISTKPNMIKRAKELSMYTVFRLFVLDSMALESLQRQAGFVHADFIEILPGVMPKIVKRVCRMSRVPIIAGGLIADKEDVINALGAGAIAISTTNQEVWFF